jgi:uncharacterized protein
MAAPSLQPVAPAERLLVLDVARGFALAGIGLMNIEAFVGPLDRALDGVDPGWHGIDRIADTLVYLLVQGKFYTLFALLFGMGFALMVERAERAGRAFAPFYLRRSVALLAIGLAHALLVWSGDILVSYALLALLLPAFREAPVRWLPWLALAVYLAAPMLVLGLGALGQLAQASPQDGAHWQAQLQAAGEAARQTIEAQRQAYGHGNWWQATVQRAHDLGATLRGLLVNGPLIFGMFLFGAWFVRGGAIRAPQDHARLYRRLRWIAWPAGLVLMLASWRLQPWLDPARMDLGSAAAFALACVANLLMCLGYLAWVLRAVAALRWLAPAGRMALSNYLLQSLVCTGVFYGYGLGLFERLPRAWQLPFVLGLFGLQVLASRAWLGGFRFGPVEWLWRAATYLRWPPLRR